jgi:carboxyl-terminal processing protease
VLALVLAGLGQPASAERALAVDQPGAAGDPLQLETFDHAWGRIRETYYDPGMKGVDWDAVRDELRPRAAAARDAALLRPILQDMIGRLGESHFMVLPGPGSPAGDGEDRTRRATRADAADGATPAGPMPRRVAGLGDLGFDLRLLREDGVDAVRAVVTRVDRGGPADLAGVRPGWILLELEGLGAEEAVALGAAEATDARLQDLHAIAALRDAGTGPSGTVATATFLHAGLRRAVLEMTRREPPGEVFAFGNLPAIVTTTESEVLPGTNVGTVRFNMFLVPVAEPFAEAMREFVARGVDGVIVDVRGNPGGIGAMVMGLAGHFIAEEGRSLGAMRLRGTTLQFVAIPRAAAEAYAGPVAVLVDELSMSTAELFAAGLQGLGRARVFGTTSAGMALPSTIESLPNGDRLQFVLADLTGPGGARIEGRGVVPDEPVPLTREALLSGQDPVVAAALAWIARQKQGTLAP